MCVFPLTASRPLWNQARYGRRDQRPELRDALQMAGPGVNWELAPAARARELALTHRKPLVTYIGLNDTINTVDYMRPQRFSVALARSVKENHISGNRVPKRIIIITVKQNFSVKGFTHSDEPPELSTQICSSSQLYRAL